MFSKIWNSQRDCIFNLNTDFPNDAGAEMGLRDWLMEDAIVTNRLYDDFTALYSEFLAHKNPEFLGSACGNPFVNPMLFAWQSDIVLWALRKGRAAIFADCGLGKTPMQLTWAQNVMLFSGKPVLILAPLAINGQTRDEGLKFHVSVRIAEEQSDVVDNGIWITNYEKLHKFSPDQWGGIVLDESSILKSFDGITRNALVEFAKKIPYRLCCTATPAPNDLLEIANHADFLGVLTPKEVQALFFRLEGNTTHQWRLKHHAEDPFWAWLAEWSVSLRKPSDLGYSDEGFSLPALNIIEVRVDSTGVESSTGLTSRIATRRATMQSRISKTVELIESKPDDTWVIWCELNEESRELAKRIPGAVELLGSQNANEKLRIITDFKQGKIQYLITKPKLSGFGSNWQHCANTVLAGLSDSYEQFYQLIRRFWRYGQKRPVNAYLITSDAEQGVLDNVKRKEADVERMMTELVKRTSVYSDVLTKRTVMDIESQWEFGAQWELILGDCVSELSKLQKDSVGLSVFSPPFPSMYVYSNSPNDVGNVKNIEQLIDQMVFVSRKLYDVLMPGRSCAIHLTQAVAFLGVDGYVGFKDFRGKVIDMMERTGWVYYGEVCIDKNPQVKAIRTHDAGLLFKSLATDASKMHMCLADYVLQFKKPGVNIEKINAGSSEKYKTEGWISQTEWIEWAAPVWYRQTKEYPGGIKETDVLRRFRDARDEDDEKHICPLQLGVIERCIKLWSNPGDIVIDPFSGIGSTGVQALKYKRRFIGIELKRSYYDAAVTNLRHQEEELRLDAELGL